MHEIGVLPLHGVVQHYDWGGHDFIPGLLGIANSDKRPFAELWMGAHPKAPATADVAGIAMPLDRLIAEAPDRILGPSASARFGGRLPYLFKVLDVASMLSIQVHPTKSRPPPVLPARTQPESTWVPPNGTTRMRITNRRWPLALTDFWMLHGFRPLEQIAEALRKVPGLRSIMPDFSVRLARAGDATQVRRDLVRDLYCAAMTMPQERVDLLLNALVERLATGARSDKDSPDYWVARAAETFRPVGGHRDRGIFSIYLLNLMHLRPGQGTFQPASTLHAYLEGVTVELMASSDNVLRGGLTRKHVAVSELMGIVSFDDGTPQVLDGEPAGSPDRPSDPTRLMCCSAATATR